MSARRATATRLPILRILAHAMDAARGFLKLSAPQATAWQVVRDLLDDPPI